MNFNGDFLNWRKPVVSGYCLIKLEENSNQLLSYTKIIKDSPLKTKSEIVEQLWRILISDNNVDLFESNLMRRICGLIYFPDKESGEIKMRLIKSK